MVNGSVFDELLITVEAIGIEKTMKVLQDAKANSLLLEDLNISFVITAASEVTDVSKQRILSGTDKSDERKIAVALCVYFTKKQGYSFGDLKKVFGKDTSALCRYYAIVENMPKSPKTDFDKKMLEYYKKIDFALLEKKNTK